MGAGRTGSASRRSARSTTLATARPKRWPTAWRRSSTRGLPHPAPRRARLDRWPEADRAVSRPIARALSRRSGLRRPLHPRPRRGTEVPNTLEGPAGKVLQSLQRHWSDPPVFVDRSEVAMDHDVAEPGQRTPRTDLARGLRVVRLAGRRATAESRPRGHDARFSILLWIPSSGLASRILSLAHRRPPNDRLARQGYHPALPQTFVNTPWHQCTGQHAANWITLGHPAGRGKKCHTRKPIPLSKDIAPHPADDANSRFNLCRWRRRSRSDCAYGFTECLRPRPPGVKESDTLAARRPATGQARSPCPSGRAPRLTSPRRPRAPGRRPPGRASRAAAPGLSGRPSH